MDTFLCIQISKEKTKKKGMNQNNIKEGRKEKKEEIK